jgi:hypothetical protein
MKRIDAIIIGFCIIAAAFIIAHMSQQSGQRTGRFQIAGSSGVTVFVLDTETGKVWSKFVNQTSGPTNWDEDTGPWVRK